VNDSLLKTLTDLGLSDLSPLFEAQDIDDSVLGDLSDADLKDIGIDKLGTRKKLLTAFTKSSGGGAAAISVAEESTPQGGSSGAPKKTAATPAEATKDLPWVNTLGMPFVPIPRFETRFCIWPVRVQDYEAYCMASGAQFPEIPFPQESDHPIVGVTWNDAIEFCVWLTGKERAEGKIDEKTVYRLPTDSEWSAAVGLPHEPEETPEERHLKAPGYPWGLRWPPPKNSGNYEHDREDQLGYLLASRFCARNASEAERDNAEYGASPQSLKILGELQEGQRRLAMLHREWRSNWSRVEDCEFTSAVDSFASNNFGIYDLGGNAWEWCMDSPTERACNKKVLRGGSFSALPSTSEAIFKDTKCFPDLGPQYQKLNFDTNDLVYRSAYRFITDMHNEGTKYLLRPDASGHENFQWAAEMTMPENLMRVAIKDHGFRLVVAAS
jgi:formylglycine-generating enzyme required for sulfatase activity